MLQYRQFNNGNRFVTGYIKDKQYTKILVNCYWFPVFIRTAKSRICSKLFSFLSTKFTDMLYSKAPSLNAPPLIAILLTSFFPSAIMVESCAEWAMPGL